MTNEQLAALLQSVAGRFRGEITQLEEELLAAPCVETREFTNILGYKRQNVVALEGLKEVLDDTYTLINMLRNSG